MRILLTVLLLVGPAAASAQADFTVDDLLRIEEVAEPVFSPDGETLVYVVTGPGEGDARQSDLWQVGWTTGAARPLHATLKRDEYSPAFSADGKTLAFLRSGANGGPGQLWVSEMGARARKVTKLPGGVDHFALAPDASFAIVATEVGANVGEGPDVAPPIVIDRLIVKEDGRGWLDDRRSHLFRIDMASGEARQLTEGDFDHWLPALSPDGQWLAFVAKRCLDADRRACSDVWVMPAGGGEARRVSRSENADADPSLEAGGPQWSPDSRSLVWVRTGPEATTWYTPTQLVVADVTTGEERQVSWIDRWFYQPRWSSDGRHLLALVEQDRDTWLARIDATSGAIEWLTEGKRFAYGYAEGADGRIAVLDSDSMTPTQLRALGGRVLSPHNAWIEGRTLAETRDIAFASDGYTIHGQLVLPPDHRPGQRHPLLVRLHGGPVYQFSHEFMADWQVFAARGYAVLGINPRGSSGRGAAFAQAQMAKWGGPDVRDISAGIDHVLALDVADPEAIGVGGWSYGGILTNYMIAREPRIRAAVSGAGMANFLGGYGVDQYSADYELELGRPWEATDRWLELSYPFFEADRIAAPTLFLCAEADWNVPCTGSQQLYTALKSRGLPTRLVVYPDESHSLSVPSYVRDRMERSLSWYDWYLRSIGEDPLAK